MNEIKSNAGKRGAEKRRADLEAHGLITIAEASRMIGCDRKEVIRLLAIGSLEESSESPYKGQVVKESLDAYLDALANRETDPATEHLKDIAKAQMHHIERMMGLVMPHVEKLIGAYENRVKTLEGQAEKLFDQQIDNMRLHRELADGAQERLLELKRADATEGRIERGVKMLEDHLPGMLMHADSKNLAELVGAGRNLFSSFTDEQSASLIQTMTPEQLAHFGKLAAALAPEDVEAEGVTSDAAAE